MIITKGDLIGFFKSFGELYKLKDEKLSNSLNELCEILYTYWLFDRRSDYILTDDWQIRDVMYMNSKGDKRNNKEYCDLIQYYLHYKRGDKIDSIIK